MGLLDDSQLDRSSVVANRQMNRERTLAGTNGYAREIGLDPLQFLRERHAQSGRARWLDLCCGSGRALIEAAAQFAAGEMTGVDLVGMFHPHEPRENLRLVEASLNDWPAEPPYELITCVHGWHYLGDKLGLATRVVRWLASDGLFVANLDIQNLTLPRLTTARQIAAALRRLGFEYDTRRKLFRCRGARRIEIPW
jgi:trans-aconitate methyltransferase